ncbi:hypothetical protein ACJIZ3_008947 [Penstemon smallii]|uniref:Transposase-associated domain-containing protein n=1 Tax=Penstemon smallii TaxID=265156 RepID=A0ABD3TC88_9LAMI
MDNPIHRDWMYNRMLGRDFNPAWLVGVNHFLEFAKSQRDYLESRQIRCPCRKCKNMRYANPEQVHSDLLRNGFVADYWCWTCHGEEENDNLNNDNNGASSSIQFMDEDVVYDAMRGGNFDCNVGDTVYATNPPNNGAEDFYNVLESAQRPLYEGCNTYTELSLRWRNSDVCLARCLPK